jgi:peroxiredoxin
MNKSSLRIHLMRISALILALTGAIAIAEQGTRAPLLDVKDRKPAPDFALQDSSGKTIRLTDYRGKVLLLDFWATWCTGCKAELPLFSELLKEYGPKGFAVVGVSVDEEGWKVVRPYLQFAKVPYEMVLVNSPTMHQYGVENMPNTFLIDQQGRVAAAYKAALVDRQDAEAHIRQLLSLNGDHRP